MKHFVRPLIRSIVGYVVSWLKIFAPKLVNLKTAPIDVKMITLGDKLSNIRAINRDYNAIGDTLWQRFNQKDKNEHHWYYQGIADCLAELSKYPVYQEYCELVKKTFNQ